jgi:hypothetical protein
MGSLLAVPSDEEGNEALEMKAPVHIDRPFRVWEFLVAHNQLLIRSPKDSRNPFTIDLRCWGVVAMSLQATYQSLVVREATGDEMNRVEAPEIREGDVTLIVGDGASEGFIRCAGYELAESELEFYESSLDFSEIDRWFRRENGS